MSNRIIITVGLCALCAIAALLLLWKNQPTGSTFSGGTNVSPDSTSLVTIVESTIAPPPVRTKIIDAVLSQPRRMHKPSTIPHLSNAEEEHLIQACKQIGSPTNRFGVLATLAFGGSERSAEFFQWMLEQEFAGRSITLDEEDVLLIAARLLGALGDRSTNARALVVRGSQVKYWSERSLWKTERNTPVRLANDCIQGLGLLPGGKAHLQRLIQGQLEQGDAVKLYSAVLTAASSADAIEQVGRKAFFDTVFLRHEQFDYHSRWKSSEQATSWVQWAEAVKKKGNNASR